MSCPVAPLEACAHGFLDAEESARVRSHAAACPGCSALLASFERERRAIGAAAAGLPLQDPMGDGLFRAGLERRRERPRMVFFRRLAMAAPLLFCAFVVWTLVRQDPAREAAELVEKLGSDRIEVREEASRRLIELGDAAAPRLRELAKDPDAEKASRARNLLAQIAIAATIPPELRRARPGIERRLSPSDNRTWTQEFLETVKQKQTPLRSQDLEVLVTRALRGAERLEELHPILDEISSRKLKVDGADLIGLLDRPDTSAYAARAISKSGSVEALREVIRRIDELPNRHYHPATVKILQEADPSIVVPELLKLLDKEDRRSRGRATWILGELKAKEAVLRIRPLASDRDTELRRCTAFALGNIGATEAIPDLIRLLEDRDFNVRCVTAQALVKLQAVDAAPALIRGLQDLEPAYRLEAARSLGALRSKEAIAGLLKVLRSDPVESLRWVAATSLAQLGAREAAPDIVALLDSEDFTTVCTALAALRTLGAEEVLPEIARRREKFEAFPGSAGPAVLRTAALAIAELTARKGIPALAALLTEGSKDVRIQAARQLCLSGSREGVPTILQEGRSLEVLNALREPDLYKRLDRPFPGSGSGSDPLGFKHLAEAAGLTLDVTAAPHLAATALSASSGGTVRELLTYLLDAVSCDVILSEGKLRLLPRAAALEEWKAWWAEEQKKK